MIRGLFFLLLIGLSQFTQAQIVSNQYLPFFNVQKIGSHVNAQWRTGIDFTCNDVDLYYGKDSNAMELLYSYPGTCGGPEEEIDYNYLHEYAQKDILFYQLRLGIYGRTYVHKMDNRGTPNYIAYPNPVLSSFKMEFDGIETGNAQVTFFNISGNILKTANIEIGKPTIDLSLFPSGLYYFTATFSNYGKVVNGKINKI